MFSIFLPVVFLVGLTLTVLIRLPMIRIAEAKADPSLTQRAALDNSVYSEKSRKHEANFKNLFELPVLFYVAAIFAILFGATNAWTGLLAWVFVSSRLVHTVIHVTVNAVVPRFGAYAVGMIALVLLWVTLIFEAGDSLVFQLDEIERQRELLDERGFPAISRPGI